MAKSNPPGPRSSARDTRRTRVDPHPHVARCPIWAVSPHGWDTGQGERAPSTGVYESFSGSGFFRLPRRRRNRRRRYPTPCRRSRAGRPSRGARLVAGVDLLHLLLGFGKRLVVGTGGHFGLGLPAGVLLLGCVCAHCARPFRFGDSRPTIRRSHQLNYRSKPFGGKGMTGPLLPRREVADETFLDDGGQQLALEGEEPPRREAADPAATGDSVA